MPDRGPWLRRSGLHAWAAALGVACGLAACGSALPPVQPGPPNLTNIGQIEGAIEATVLSQDHLHAVAYCPEQVPAIVGQLFSCVVAVRGRAQPEIFSVQVQTTAGYVTYARIQ